MTADDAGQSWLDRTTAIISEYADPNYSKEAVHNEASLAAQGISQLLQHRYNELSPGMVENLQTAVDVCAQINADTLDAAYKSPWASASSGFVQDVQQEISAGVTAVKDAGKKAASAFSFDITMVAIAAVAIGLLFMLVNAKATRAFS
jgi:hypothetical protein